MDPNFVLYQKHYFTNEYKTKHTRYWIDVDVLLMHFVSQF